MKTIEDVYIDLFKPYPKMQRDKEVIRKHYKEYLPAINKAIEKKYIIEDLVIYWWIIDDSILYSKKAVKFFQKSLNI